MSNVRFDQSYLQARAEQGKFAVVDKTYLETSFNYPASGEGRYAVLIKEAEPIKVTYLDDATDAFGRLRVSEPCTLFNSKLTLGKYPEYWDEIVNGSALSTHVSADANVNLSVAASGDYAIRQTKQRWIYQSGKSQYAMLTFSNFQTQSNVIKRVGLFYSNYTAPYNNFDGIYLESNGVTNSYNFCIAKSNGSNTGTQTVAQSAWSEDKFDGTGKSQITLDLSKNQILYMDYEWLGTGTVRLGFIIDGIFHSAHHFHHANITQDVYMTSPNLPVRYEIRSVGTSGTGNLKQICSAVMSEGGYQPTGAIYSISRAASGLGTFSDANIPVGDIVPLLAIRLKEGCAGDNINVLSLKLAANGAIGMSEILVLHNPIYSVDDGTWTPLTNTAIEYNATSTIASRITSVGMMVDSFYYSATNNSVNTSMDVIQDVVSLGTQINGTRDKIVIAIRKVAGNNSTNMYGSLTFRDLR